VRITLNQEKHLLKPVHDESIKNNHNINCRWIIDFISVQPVFDECISGKPPVIAYLLVAQPNAVKAKCTNQQVVTAIIYFQLVNAMGFFQKNRKVF